MDDKDEGGAGGYILFLCILLTTSFLYYKLRQWKSGSSGVRGAAEKGVVVLHCPPPAINAPSMSPFVLKIMTFLRYANIPHQYDHSQILGPKGKTPWVTLDGEVIEDSEIIMTTLTQRFDKVEALSPLDQALSTSLSTMMDHHFAWCLRVFRYQWDKGYDLGVQRGLPWYFPLVLPLLCWRMRRALWHHGVGRHDEATVVAFVREDLNAVNGCLGGKPFLLGDQPAIIDVKIFAHLVNFLYNYKRSPFYPLIAEFPALLSYVERMKDKFWPDWDKCVYMKP